MVSVSPPRAVLIYEHPLPEDSRDCGRADGMSTVLLMERIGMAGKAVTGL